MDRSAREFSESAIQASGHDAAVELAQKSLLGEAFQPFGRGIEEQLRPWNQLGSLFVDAGRNFDALEVWCGMYLTCLALQGKHHQRFHKGMALCNIGFALGRVRETAVAPRGYQAKSWMLGVVEDSLTDLETAFGQRNLRNLLTKKGLSKDFIYSIPGLVAARFVYERIMPESPEFVVRSIFGGQSDQLTVHWSLLNERLSREPGRWCEGGETFWTLVRAVWDSLNWPSAILDEAESEPSVASI